MAFITFLSFMLIVKVVVFLLNARSCISLGQLRSFFVPSDIQAIPFETKLRKEKWFFLFIYKHPCQYFLDSISNIFDQYFDVCNYQIVMVDFNFEPSHSLLSAFMDSRNYFNLIKWNRKWSYIKQPGILF